VHLTFSVACKKRSANQRNTKIMELEGFGSRKRTIYFANVHESVLCVWLSVCWEFSVVADQMCF
jgi:hypothetical protein